MKFERNNLRVFLLALALLFASSESLPTFRYVLSFLFILLAGYLQPKFIAPKKFHVRSMIILLFVIFLAVTGYLELLTYKKNLEYGLFSSIFGISFKIIIGLIIIAMSENSNTLYRVIGITIALNLAVFFGQTILVYTVGYYVDIVYLFSSEVSRYGSGFTLPIIGTIYRPTGMYVEPSTYASFMMLFVTIRYFLVKKIDRIDQLALISCVLTFSIAAIAYGILAIILLFLASSVNVTKKYILMSVCILSLPVIYLFFESIISSRILYTGGSAVSLRENLLEVVFQQQSMTEVFLGNGLLGYPSAIIEIMSSGSLWSGNISALNDNGIWLFIIMKFGILGLGSFLLFTHFCCKDKVKFSLIVIALITKLSLLNFTFLFLMVVMFISRLNRLEDGIE